MELQATEEPPHWDTDPRQTPDCETRSLSESPASAPRGEELPGFHSPRQNAAALWVACPGAAFAPRPPASVERGEVALLW